MSDNEVIWIERDESCPYFYQTSELADAAPPLVAYIRADIVAEFFAWADKPLSDLSGNDDCLWNIPGKIITEIGD